MWHAPDVYEWLLLPDLLYDNCLGLCETSKGLMDAKLLEVWLVSAMQSLYEDAADSLLEERKAKLLCLLC